MVRIVTLCLLFLYYYYFYFAWTPPSTTKPGSGPSPPRDFDVRLMSRKPRHAEFVVNQQSSWEHELSTDRHAFHDDRMIPIDVCHAEKEGALIPARGQILYQYLKSHPDAIDFVKFHENRDSNIYREGEVFYFRCGADRRIQSLHLCPPGSSFVLDQCKAISLCTDKPDHTFLPDPSSQKHYILCSDGKQYPQSCPEGYIFRYNRCEKTSDLNHYCSFFPEEPSFKLDDTTRVECRDGKPFYVKCTQPGTRFFERDYCEPDDCVGLADGTTLPLPERTVGPFRFSPGFKVCRNGRVDETRECASLWDDRHSKGDDLTFLPRVFDGQKCSVPTWC